MFDYKTLENTNIEMLYKGFLGAFSDYQVEIDLSLFDFCQLLQRRGYVPGISIGAFKDEELVGFVLNGLRNWRGEQTVYDIGTGVIREYRKQGITNNMLLKVKELFNKKDVSRYLLEVIQSNTSAVRIYKKQGFKIIRNLLCFELDNKDEYDHSMAYKVEHVNRIKSNEWKLMTSFWDFIPSWQNSIDSINAVSDTFVYSVVRVNNTKIGYGIVSKKTGDIPQIAVDKNYRHKGIGRSIITDLLKNTESQKIRIFNIDEDSESMTNFIFKSGFKYKVGQYEMALKL